MLNFLLDTLSHFPACFLACIFSHYVLAKFSKTKTCGNKQESNRYGKILLIEFEGSYTEQEFTNADLVLKKNQLTNSYDLIVKNRFGKNGTIN